jgi:hypothetical protein
MVGKISIKKAAVVIFSCGIVMILYACMSPIDLQTFMDDPIVQGVIETTKKPTPVPPVVKIDDKTGDGLTGLNGKIDGLKTDKYYMVEKEFDADGVLVPEYGEQGPYPMYVTDYPGLGPGGLFNDLGFITRIKAGSINNLINLHTYTVRAAEPLAPEDGKLKYTEGGGETSYDVTGGKITILGSGNGTLDLSTVFTGNYEVMAVYANASQTSPWSWESKTSDDWDPNSLVMGAKGSEIDYIFVKEGFPSDFRVLTVKIEEPGIALVLTFTIDDKTTVTSNSSSIAIGSLNGSSTATLTLNVTGGSAGDINWYHNNTLAQADGTTLVLKNDNPANTYMVLGKHVFTVTLKVDGTPYSANFTLTVTE